MSTHTRDRLQRQVSPSFVRLNAVSSEPNHHAQSTLELQRALGNQALQRLLQRKAPIAAESPAPKLDALTLTNLEGNPPVRIEDPVTWRTLERLMAKPNQAKTLAPLLNKYFTYFIETDPQITFENITENERKLLLDDTVLAPQAHERLRLVALQNTALFKAITDVTVDLSAPDKGVRQTRMTKERLEGAKGDTPDLDAEPGSAAEQYIRWDVEGQGVVAEVLSNATDKERNAPLASLIVKARKKNPSQLKDVLAVCRREPSFAVISPANSRFGGPVRLTQAARDTEFLQANAENVV